MHKDRTTSRDLRWLSSAAQAEFLRATVADYPVYRGADWSQVNVDALISASEHHRVSAFLVPTINYPGTPEPIRAFTRLVELRRRFTQARMAVDLNQIVEVADRLNRPWVLLKGPTLVATAYQGAAREYGDLDVLVDGRDLRSMVDGLCQLGGTLLDRNFEMLTRATSGEIGVMMPMGSMVDLHWHPIHTERVRRHFRIPVAQLIERGSRLALGEGGPVVRALEASDALLYLSLHACLSGGERLLWLKDIDMLSRRLQWNERDLVSRAMQWGIGPAAGLILRRAQRIFGSPIDPALTTLLVHSLPMRGVGSVLDRWAPPNRQTRNGQDRVFFRATRGSARATSWELVKQLASSTVLPNRYDRVRPWREYTVRGVVPNAVETSAASKAQFFAIVAAAAAREG